MTDWVTTTLGDIGEPIIGLTYSPDQVNDEGTLVLRSSNIQQGRLSLDDVVRVIAPIPDKLRVRRSDVLICVRNGSRPLIGKSLCLDDRVVGETFGAFMAVYRSQLNPYLRHFFQSYSFKRQVDEHLGATINQITNRSLRGFQVTYPIDAKERDLIASSLSEAEALVESLELLITKKRDVKQGMMQELLTGRTRLPGYSGEWRQLSVAAMSHLKARIGWQGLTTEEYLNTGEYRLVGGTNFLRGRIDWDDTSFVDKWRFDQDANIQLQVGDVLLTKDGTIGKVAYVDSLPGPATLNSGVFVLRPKWNSYDSGFLFCMLQSRAFADFVTGLRAGSTINHLYQRDLVALNFQVPADLAEQRAIASALFDVDAEIVALELRLGSARAVKEGMMQELLTGRTRLSLVEGAA